MERMVVKLAESNEYGDLDHGVALPSGATVHNVRPTRRGWREPRPAGPIRR
jgi:hypothetical protein